VRTELKKKVLCLKGGRRKIEKKVERSFWGKKEGEQHLKNVQTERQTSRHPGEGRPGLRGKGSRRREKKDTTFLKKRRGLSEERGKGC